jgi:hypothetical protein
VLGDPGEQLILDHDILLRWSTAPVSAKAGRPKPRPRQAAQG